MTQYDNETPAPQKMHVSTCVHYTVTETAQFGKEKSLTPDEIAALQFYEHLTPGTRITQSPRLDVEFTCAPRTAVGLFWAPTYMQKSGTCRVRTRAGLLVEIPWTATMPPTGQPSVGMIVLGTYDEQGHYTPKTGPGAGAPWLRARVSGAIHSQTTGVHTAALPHSPASGYTMRAEKTVNRLAWFAAAAALLAAAQALHPIRSHPAPRIEHRVTIVDRRQFGAWIPLSGIYFAPLGGRVSIRRRVLLTETSHVTVSPDWAAPIVEDALAVQDGATTTGTIQIEGFPFAPGKYCRLFYRLRWRHREGTFELRDTDGRRSTVYWAADSPYHPAHLALDCELKVRTSDSWSALATFPSIHPSNH